MKIYSDVVNRELEVSLFDTADKKKGIRHESLESILYNELKDVEHSLEIVTATPDYAAVVFRLKDKNGRSVYGANDTNVNRTDIDGKFSMQHPMIQAIQSAMDAAVKAYLNWPKFVREEDLKKNEEKTESSNPQPSDEQPSGTETEPDAKEFGMNPPEPEPDPEPELPSEYSEMSDEELGNTLVLTGKYKDKTLSEVWKLNPAWFEFISSRTTHPLYGQVKEYLKRNKKEA